MKTEIHRFILMSMLLALLLFIISSSSANTQQLDNCTKYTRNFLKNKPEHFEKIKHLIETVKTESINQSIDPIIPTILISLESSWDYNTTGDIGERGLMQVLPRGVCSKGQDLSTPEGQIRAGVNCLVLSRVACGDNLKKILTMYASGKCVSKSEITKRKMNHRVKLIKEWSN